MGPRYWNPISVQNIVGTMRPASPVLNLLTRLYISSPVGTFLERDFIRSTIALNSGWVIRRLRQLVRNPMFSEMDIPLSLRTTMNFSGLRCTMLFSASKLDPDVIAPSPTTAMVQESVRRFAAPWATPRAMESPVPAWPAHSVSWGLSPGSPNPDRPPSRRMSWKSSRRPVHQLVRVSLVGRVPDYPVFGAVEEAVNRQCELHDAQIRGQVAAALGYDGDDGVSRLLRNLGQLAVAKSPQVAGRVDSVQ